MIGAFRTISVRELKAVLDGTDGEQVRVVDVREPHEYDAGHVPGAELLPLMTVPHRIAELSADRPLYLVCAVGARSGQAAAFLAARGIEAVNVDGGTNAWVAAGYPLVR